MKKGLLILIKIIFNLLNTFVAVSKFCYDFLKAFVPAIVLSLLFYLTKVKVSFILNLCMMLSIAGGLFYAFKFNIFDIFGYKKEKIKKWNSKK